jgi:hypothetical protein
MRMIFFPIRLDRFIVRLLKLERSNPNSAKPQMADHDGEGALCR